MEERRKNRRMELVSKLLIKRMDAEGEPREVNIEVTDASKTGVGFVCGERLEKGASRIAAYDTIETFGE